MLRPSSSHSSHSSTASTASLNSKASNLHLNGNNSNFNSDNETPQSFWLNTFLRKAGNGFSSGAFGSEKEFKASLVKDLAAAMEIFSVDKFRTDYYFLLIWLSYIKLQFELHGDEDDCRKMFKMMKSSHIGLHHPEFFLHWADFEIKVDRRDKSLAVLSSANDTPIMRGNPQIKAAKELIEADKNLTLEALFTLNLSRKSVTAAIPAAVNNFMPTPSTKITGFPALDPLKTTESLNDKFSKITRTEIGLGPAKRVKEDYENKENREFKDNINILPTPTATAVTEHTGHTNQSGNSNMSLTMTELNLKPVVPEDTGTYNILNNTSNNTLNNTLNNTNNTITNTILPNNNAAVNVNNNSAPLKSRQVRVNGKIYRVLQLIGRGGSSKVFRVIDVEGQIFALKKVNLKNLDEVTLNSYTNEISLLKSFANNPHIIQLIDSEMNKEQACLYILMEYGEVDLGKMLKNRVDNGLIGEKADENFIRFSFQQMLMAVNTVHEAKIVHCDLKPANFLLVQGTLKLIDFGISKAIMNDTTNIVRENQVGTVNYMSPEALQETSISTQDHRGRLKIGRPSDIWSLGCILYEMTFGKPPFAQFTTLIQRLHKILDPGYEIEFPPTFPNSDLIGVIKGCLQRPPKERLTLPQLFQHSFLKPSTNFVQANDKVLITRDQIYNLLEKFSEAYPGINPALLTDRIFQQWKNPK